MSRNGLDILAKRRKASSDRYRSQNKGNQDRHRRNWKEDDGKFDWRNHRSSDQD